MRRHAAWIRRVTLSNIMRFSVYDGVFSPAACTLLHAFSSWDHSSIVARNTLLEGALTCNGGTRCFDRRNPATPLEFALESFLSTLANDDEPQFVEYWTRQNWAHVKAHADMDEYYKDVFPDMPPRHPTNGHVLYLSVGAQVRGPTCVWEGTADSPFGGNMAVVPAVSGRLLRFDGALQHAVPKPADVWLNSKPALKGDDDVAEPEEMIRSVVLFNTWREPPADLLRETGSGAWDSISPDDVRCSPRHAWQKAPLATPLGGRQTGVMRLALLGGETRRGYAAESIEVPVNHDVLRCALDANNTATVVPPPAQVHEAHEGRVVPATVSYPPLGVGAATAGG